MVKRVGLDIDGVLANFGKAFAVKAQSMGLDIGVRADRWYYQDKWMQRSNETVTKVWNEVKASASFWLSLETFDEDEWLVNSPIVYITARPIDSRFTVRWLDVLKFPPAPVETVDYYADKIPAMNKYKLDTFVDDHIEAFELYRRHGFNCLLMDRPWNRSYDTRHRIYSVNEAW